MIMSDSTIISSTSTCCNSSNNNSITTTTTTTTTNHQDPSPSTITMATIWFALCATLVQKHTDLLAVFFAFVGSFALLYISKKPVVVKAVATISSLTFLLVDIPSTTTTTTTCCCSSSPYLALSILTGHAAFSLWFAFLHYGPLPSTWHLLQEAVSLTLGVVILVVWRQILNQYHTQLLLWTWYKVMEWIMLALQQQQQSSGSNIIPMSPPILITKDGLNNNNNDDESPQHHLSSSLLPSSSLWCIHGVQYDLTDFTERHPGGKEAILLGQGRDCTALFESYHPFSTQHELVLNKYKIIHDDDNCSTNNEKKKTATKLEQDVFYDIIKERVYRTLKEQGMDPDRDRTAPPLRLAYYCLVILCVVMAGVAHMKGSILGSFFLAFFGWFLGALGHDAGHFAVSHHAKVNDICVWGMSLLCNPILWQHQHTYAHHSHTNDFDRDPDLHHFTMLLRVHRNFQHQPLYEWQRNPLFVTLAYTLVVFGTCIWIPIGMLQEGSLYGMVEYTDRNRPWRAFGMMAHWVGYTSVILLLPFFVCTSWYRALASIIVHIATSGLMFGFFSQVNHLNEHSMEAATSRTATRNNNNTSAATAASSSKTLCAANSWAAAQVESSNNFCTNSSLWHILSNGLNLQIEHHLFPGLNHSHLHRIAPVVKATCEEYGVMYKTYDSWSELMKATLEWLDKLSIEA